MQIAAKTLEAIDANMQVDQGNKWRGIMKERIFEADDPFRSDETPFRSHLGASGIGKECARAIFYSHRWATKPHFEGRILRLFNRGHLEEPRMVALLQLIGAKVWQYGEDGKQFKIKGHRGHFGGSTDGVVLGIPDMPAIPMLLECKTCADKYFKTLVANGVASDKWEHYVQMQIYMGKMELSHALYMVANKNTDALHMEIVEFDIATYERYCERAAGLVDTMETPPKINQSAGWYKCKICDHRGVCHDAKVMPVQTCRSCVNVRLVDGGKWSCGDNGPILSAEDQLSHADCYVMASTFKSPI